MRTATTIAPSTTSALTRNTALTPLWAATSPSAGLPRPSARSNAVRGNQAWGHPCCTKRSTLNVVSAANPAVVNASPTPGTQTAPTTRMIDGRALAEGGTDRTGATSASVTNGTSAVASAMEMKPNRPYKAVPTGAPIANATYIARPTHAMILPVFCGPSSPRPQARAPVTIKLSAPPSTQRPTSRMAAEVDGVVRKL